MKPDSPTPETIKQTRLHYELSTEKAAALIYRTSRNWQQWEAGQRKMDVALWELFLYKAEKQKKG